MHYLGRVIEERKVDTIVKEGDKWIIRDKFRKRILVHVHVTLQATSEVGFGDIHGNSGGDKRVYKSIYGVYKAPLTKKGKKGHKKHHPCLT